MTLPTKEVSPLSKIHSRFALLLLLAFVVVAASACGRNARSRQIPPPIDPQRELIEARINSLLRDAELRLGTRQDYFIGPGDIIGLVMVDRPDIFPINPQTGARFTITVTENPMVTLPLIGSIRIHGRTADEFQEAIREAFAQFITDPKPIVTIEKFHFNQVSVLGSVQRPGRFPLDYGDTLIDAIFKAGGLSFGRGTGAPPPARFLKIYRDKLDNRERTQLSREELLERLRDDQGRIIPRTSIVVPIEEFILSGNLDYNLPLAPNDIVYIPPAGTVSIVGRVHNPGVVFLGPSIRTLTQVITEAGGQRYSTKNRLEVVRTYSDGSQESFFLNIRDMRNRRVEDFVVQDNDQIFLYVLWTRDVLEFLGRVFGASVSGGVRATYAPI